MNHTRLLAAAMVLGACGLFLTLVWLGGKIDGRPMDAYAVDAALVEATEH